MFTLFYFIIINMFYFGFAHFMFVVLGFGFCDLCFYLDSFVLCFGLDLDLNLFFCHLSS
jgi:hypothetical protein